MTLLYISSAIILLILINLLLLMFSCSTYQEDEKHNKA